VSLAPGQLCHSGGGDWTRGFVFLVVRLYWQHDKSMNKCREVSCATF